MSDRPGSSWRRAPFSTCWVPCPTRPAEADLPSVGGEALKGGDAAANAVALQSVLDGMPSPYRDIALLNAAAALIVAGRAATLKEGVAIGRNSLDSGAAAASLKRLIAISNS